MKTIAQLQKNKYGKLSIISEDNRYTFPCGAKTRKIKCICDCGKTTSVLLRDLLSGHTKSCGCYLNTFRVTHKRSRTSLYRTWIAMKGRCYNKNCLAYKYYGGRGIKVCNRWKESFKNFLEDMGERLENMEIDRIDNNKGYCKENCRWATRTEQNNNTRRSVNIEYNGEKHTIAQWARKKSIKYATLYARLITYGWSTERALSTIS